VRIRALTALAAGVLALAAPQAAQAAPPTLGGVSAEEVKAEAALLTGTLNPNGLATSYFFEYVDLATYSVDGFDKALLTSSASAGAGSEEVEVNSQVSGLKPETTYYFRLSAHNFNGTEQSEAATFATTAGTEIACEGDACQFLPSDPVDPTLTTLLEGPGNPKVHYRRYCRAGFRKHKGNCVAKKHGKARQRKNRHHRGKR
jgi:phosphodiesterase/alkaline phosphatase D-like protein